ncbi:MAG TPA: dynamin family protein [Mycobacteriales bacterium]
MSGALCAAVVALCQQLRPGLTPVSADRVTRVAGQLSGPLRLVVAGRIGSGKSTVVNALIGRRVAPTDVRECTRLVTRFRYGTVDRVEVVCADGGQITVPYDGEGLVPRDLGVDPGRVAYLDAFLTSAMLRSMTVIDTPGLGSLDRATSRRTEVLLGAAGGALPFGPDTDSADAGTGDHQPGRFDQSGLDAGSRAALAQAEAVLFVLTQAARADDAQALSAFHARSVPRAGGPANAVAVLNRADQVVAGSGTDPTAVDPMAADPMVAARGLAAAAATALRHRVFDVLPLAGLVAETTETGCLTQADADVLRQIAALDPPRRDLLFYSTDLFVRPEIPVPVAARARLLERLDLYGVRRAVGLILDRPTLTAGELRRALVGLSGFPVVRDVVEGVFGRRADGIKAGVALAALDEVAARAPVPVDRLRIRDAVEGLLARPAAHQLRLFEAASLVASGTVSLPDDLSGELSLLVGSDEPARQLGVQDADPGTLRQLALDRAVRWRSFATAGSTPAQSRVAHEVHRGFFLLWQRLGPDPHPGAR